MRAYVDAIDECNNNCRFCKARGSGRRSGMKSLVDMQCELAEAREQGIRFAVFSGGEPTMRPDFLELISLARSLGFDEIQLQTNARYFADWGRCLATLQAGATEFLISLHGANAGIHEWHTRRVGSYTQTIAGIQNLVQVGARVIVNTVMTQHNCLQLAKIVELAGELGASTVQLAYLHLTGEATSRTPELLVRKKLLSPYACAALDVDSSPATAKMVEALPYCLLPGHERFSADLYASASFLRQADRFGVYDKSQARAKGPRCVACSLERLCFGPWREYPEIFGWDEFEPVTTLSADALLCEVGRGAVGRECLQIET